MITKIKLDSCFKKARQLAKKGKYKKALKKYLFVFDNSRGFAGYGGVRLSYVPSEIAKIGKNYHPAIKELKKRRKKIETLVLCSKAGFDELHELTSLNHYLKASDRSVALYDRVKKTKNHGLIQDFRNLIWDDLVKLKRYNELGKEVDKMARQMADLIGKYEASRAFPVHSIDSATYWNWAERKIFKEGSQAYEILIKIGRKKTAKKLNNWLLRYKKTLKSYE